MRLNIYLLPSAGFAVLFLLSCVHKNRDAELRQLVIEDDMRGVATLVHRHPELLENRENLKMKNERGKNIADLAAQSGQTELATRLIEKGAEANVYSLARLGMTDRLFAKISPSTVNKRSELGLTLLHCAADTGKHELGERLIELGATTEVQDLNGYTPLHYAASSGHLDFVRMLLKHGADRNIRDNEGLKAIDHTTFFPEISEALRAKD